MTKVRFNKRKFFKFMYILSVLAIGAIAENGDRYNYESGEKVELG